MWDPACNQIRDNLPITCRCWHILCRRHRVQGLALPDDEVVEDFVDAGDVARQAANIEVAAVLEHSLQADSVGNAANDEGGEAEPGVGKELPLDGMLEPVGRSLSKWGFFSPG